jgi:hypothetical protein
MRSSCVIATMVFATMVLVIDANEMYDQEDSKAMLLEVRRALLDLPDHHKAAVLRAISSTQMTHVAASTPAAAFENLGQSQVVSSRRRIRGTRRRRRRAKRTRIRPNGWLRPAYMIQMRSARLAIIDAFRAVLAVLQNLASWFCTKEQLANYQQTPCHKDATDKSCRCKPSDTDMMHKRELQVGEDSSETKFFKSAWSRVKSLLKKKAISAGSLLKKKASSAAMNHMRDLEQYLAPIFQKLVVRLLSQWKLKTPPTLFDCVCEAFIFPWTVGSTLDKYEVTIDRKSFRALDETHGYEYTEQTRPLVFNITKVTQDDRVNKNLDNAVCIWQARVDIKECVNSKCSNWEQSRCNRAKYSASQHITHAVGAQAAYAKRTIQCNPNERSCLFQGKPVLLSREITLRPIRGAGIPHCKNTGTYVDGVIRALFAMMTTANAPMSFSHCQSS